MGRYAERVVGEGVVVGGVWASLCGVEGSGVLDVSAFSSASSSACCAAIMRWERSMAETA